MPRGAILFDFDGTLVDTRQASWELFAETNELFGLGVDSRDAFFRIFRNNFHESFEALSSDADHIRQAKQHFMTALTERYRPSLIPGIVDVIRALTPSYTLAVVSSNAMPVIRRVLEGAGLATCFSHVFSGDVEPSKSAVIKRFMADQSYASLRHCAPSYVDTPRPRLVDDAVFIVTDTVGDVEEARRVGIRAVGVCWGMHDEASLRAAGAETVMVWPQELEAFFVGAQDEVPDTCRLGPTPASPADAESDSGADDSCTTGVCRCHTAGGQGESSPRRAEVRSAVRLRARLAAPMATPLTPPVEVPVRLGPGTEVGHNRPAIDPELLEALRLTAVP